MAFNDSSLLSVRNRLLAKLPGDALAELLPKLVPVSLPQHKTLYASDAPIDAVYFIESGMISLVAMLDEGSQAEVGVIGREGMAGMSILAGIATSFTEAMVQIEATALRMDVMAFRHEIDHNAVLRRLLLRYNEYAYAQVSQTAACNGRHGLEARLARWLLLAHDRAERDELQLTQEFIAFMLNVHRPSVSVTAGFLQRAGLIRYSSGRIVVLDRPGLEAAACGCYATVHRRYAQLMGNAPLL